MASDKDIPIIQSAVNDIPSLTALTHYDGKDEPSFTGRALVNNIVTSSITH